MTKQTAEVQVSIMLNEPDSMKPEAELLVEAIEEGRYEVKRIDKYMGGEWYASASYDGSKVIVRDKVQVNDETTIVVEHTANTKDTIMEVAEAMEVLGSC